MAPEFTTDPLLLELYRCSDDATPWSRALDGLREATGAARLRARHSQRKRRLGLAAGAVVVTVLLVVGGVHLWKPTGAEVPSGMRR